MKLKMMIVICSVMMLFGCVGKVIDTAGDAAVATIKLPFKIVGAVVDGVTGDDKS